MKSDGRDASTDTRGTGQLSAERADGRDDRRASQYLANERTFLAWIRTSIAVITLGFVISRFSLWLRELAVQVGSQGPPHGSGASLPIGLAMMGFGAILALLSLWRFNAVNRAIERGEVRADRGLVMLVTALVVLLALAMIVYMFTTA